MLDYARKLNNVRMRVSRAQYDGDETLQAACRYWFHVISEAATHVSSLFQDATDDWDAKSDCA
jgi:hypothetical protein